MTTHSYIDFLVLALPEVILVVIGFVVLVVDLALRGRSISLRSGVACTLGSAGCLVAFTRILVVTDLGTISISHGMFAVSPLTNFVQESVLALTVITLLLSITLVFTEHIGEYVLLVLLATVGMLFLISSRNILTTFVSLELLSLSLYALTAFDKRKLSGPEAALKYFLFGGMSAAIFLYGLTYLYGVSSSTGYTEVAMAIRNTALSPMVAAAAIAVMIGFGFKVAAAPIHFWAPDVYEGAPNPVAGFIASNSKVASFFVFFIFVTTCLSPVSGSAAGMHFHAGWAAVASAFAALSMIIGNCGALAQKGLRRLLAYSAIAHTGYMLIAVVTHTRASLEALLYYVLTYSLATLGSFAVLDIVERAEGSDALAKLNGLARRAPLLSACLFLFLLSQTGIPPLAGFFAKFYLFAAALQAPEGYSALLWLVVLALAMSAVSLYYYLQVLKHIYVIDPDEGAPPLSVPWSTTVVVTLLAIAVVGLGLFPEPLRAWIHSAVIASGY